MPKILIRLPFDESIILDLPLKITKPMIDTIVNATVLDLMDSYDIDLLTFHTARSTSKTNNQLIFDLFYEILYINILIHYKYIPKCNKKLEEKYRRNIEEIISGADINDEIFPEPQSPHMLTLEHIILIMLTNTILIWIKKKIK